MSGRSGLGPRCPKCGTPVPPGLALVWAPPAGFACENRQCDAWLKMNRWRGFGLVAIALVAVRILDARLDGWPFLGAILAIFVALGVFSWLTIQPRAVSRATPR